jgi:SAM-dependent methyltransferase
VGPRSAFDGRAGTAQHVAMTGPFAATAELYDAVYGHLDYEGSAGAVEDLIRSHNPSAASLLDVACGTGRHLEVWRGRFERVAGVDVDESMLDMARRRLTGVALYRADFTGFDLGEQFDAVTCLFSSIGYADTGERLDAAVRSMASHLRRGGVLVVEAWLTPDMLSPPWVRAHVVEEPDRVILRSSRIHYNGNDEGGVTDVEFHYLVTTVEGSSVVTEHHTMGVYTPERYVAAAARAGLDATFAPEGSPLGRGLLIGVATG